MDKKICLASPHMGGDELKYVIEAFDTNWIAPLGANVDNFEKEMTEYIGSGRAVALSAGTAAIHMALKSAGVTEKDIVFCQSLTFSASANPIMYEKAIPVFIDSERDTWNMDPCALEAAFKKYPAAKAVIGVDLYGQSANWDAINAICSRYNATVIEDAAEALGSTYKGRKCGALGDFGIISFNGNKIITTSGGGMLLSNDSERIEKVRFWATQAREKARHYEHKELGFNYRMSNIAAGIGRGQMHVLPERIAKKRRIYERYQRAFSQIPAIQIMNMSGDGESNCWLSAITIAETAVVKPLDVIIALEQHNIESRPIWKPMHMQPFYQNYDFISVEGGTSVAEDIFNRGVCLPSDTKMTDRDQDRVINIIKGLF